MKQKLLKLKALLVVLMMAVGFGQAFADEVVYKTALFGADYNSVKISNYTASWSATNDGFTVNLQNWNNNNNGWSFVRAGRKNTASVASITTNAAIDEAVTKVVLTIDAVTASKINSVTLYSGDTSSDISTEEGSFTVSAGAQTVTISTPSKDKFYKIVADCASGSSNGLITVSKIEFYKKVSVDPGKTETTTAFDGESSYDVELGEEFVGPTATVSDGTSVIGGASVTYSSTDEAVATVDSETGVVALVGAGTTTIKATYAGDDTYAPSSASYTLNVTLPVPSFASLEEVAASGLSSNTKVKVSFENAVIKNIYKTNAGQRRGLYFDIKGPNDEDIEIYYGSAMPDEWEVGGTVSGTAVEFTWTLYGSTWELILKNGWGDLSYQAPVAQTANMRISAAGWATFWAPFAVEIPAGVKAYTGEMQKGWIRMNEQTKGYIPANTGVVLELVEGEPFETELSPMSPQPNEAAVESCYTGNESGAIMNVEDGDYLLQKNFDDEKKEDVVGWYKVSGEGFTLAPNRCYLSKDDVPAPNQSRTFFGFTPDDATGISSIATEAKTKADGKYMVNGQIVVVKAGKAYNMNGTEVK